MFFNSYLVPIMSSLMFVKSVTLTIAKQVYTTILTTDNHIKYKKIESMYLLLIKQRNYLIQRCQNKAVLALVVMFESVVKLG